MVMLVFTMPSSRMSQGDPRPLRAAKEIDRETVMQKYLMVKLHDPSAAWPTRSSTRASRCAVARFDPALVEELKSECASLIDPTARRSSSAMSTSSGAWSR